MVHHCTLFGFCCLTLFVCDVSEYFLRYEFLRDPVDRLPVPPLLKLSSPPDTLESARSAFSEQSASGPSQGSVKQINMASLIVCCVRLLMHEACSSLGGTRRRTRCRRALVTWSTTRRDRDSHHGPRDDGITVILPPFLIDCLFSHVNPCSLLTH